MVGMMNKKCLLAVICMIIAAPSDAVTLSSMVKSAEKPLAEVVVTDGFSFTVTDRRGYYSLDVSGKAPMYLGITRRRVKVGITR